MTAEALHPELCLPAAVGVTPQLSLEDAVVGPNQESEGVWVWGPLLERQYILTLTDVAPDFTSVVLDDGSAGKEDEPISIDLGEDLALEQTIYLLQPLDENAGEIDSDVDQLTDAQEVTLGTDPFVLDSDGDGLADGDEVGFYGTDPLLGDTDADGLNDQIEVAVSFTSPFLADTDGDGAEDGEEVAELTNPLDLLNLPATSTPEPTATPIPTPAPVSTPRASRVQPTRSLPSPSPHATPAAGSSKAGSGVGVHALDNDGLTTLDEIAIHGTDPLAPDSDGDGLGDAEEVASGRDPLEAAS
jgi:hypothetical protein